jgi:hypothetical protein
VISYGDAGWPARICATRAGDTSTGTPGPAATACLKKSLRTNCSRSKSESPLGMLAISVRTDAGIGGTARKPAVFGPPARAAFSCADVGVAAAVTV